ncbi:MAG: hypothetical protein ACI9J0_000292 [Cryomorphaceae bacterium]
MVALSLLTFGVYSLGFSGELLFDDLPNLASNSSLRFDGTVVDAWRVAALSSNAGVTGRPIPMFSFAVNSVVSGDISAYGLKLTNTVIHVAIAWLVFFLSRQLLQIHPRRFDDSQLGLIALASAAIWLLHPLQVSTVLYAVQRMAQLSTFFVLLGLLVFVRYRQQWASEGANPGDVLAALLWLGIITTLAVYSKENGILLPALVLVIELVFFKGQWAGRTIWPNKVVVNFILVLAAITFFGIFFYAFDFILAGYTIREFTLEERALTQLRVLWSYLGWFFLPDVSAMGFQHDDIPLSRGLLDPVTTLLSLAAWLIVLSAGYFYRQRFPLIIFALLFYLVGHSMESGVLALEMVYEHRNYLPIVGFCTLAGAGIVGVASRFNFNQYVSIGCVSAILLVLMLVRVSAWSDSERLNFVNLENHPDSPRTNFLYAETLWQKYHGALAGSVEQEQAKEQLITARYYFQRTWELDSRSLAALIMLYDIDQQYFPKLGEKEDWLGRLEILLSDRVLQASDYNAIDALVVCVAEGGCRVDYGRMISIFKMLEKRYPRSLPLLSSFYTYIQASGASDAELEEICNKALLINPASRDFLAKLLSLRIRQGDIGAMYDVVSHWMAADTARRDILRLKTLFST